jgi:hypothetical protein
LWKNFRGSLMRTGKLIAQVQKAFSTLGRQALP